MLSLVIPLYNEASGIDEVVSSLVSTLRSAEITYQLVLVDNGSTDDTYPQIARLAETNHAIEVVRLPRNAGYGGGILAGLEVARAPVLGYLWGDEQVAHYVVVQGYRKLVTENLDLCKARRAVRLDGWHRKLITRTYHTIFPAFFPRISSDIHGCPKLFTRSALERLRPRARDWFLDAEIMIRAHALNLELAEIDVVSYPRETGVSKVRWKAIWEFAFNLPLFKVKDFGQHLRSKEAEQVARSKDSPQHTGQRVRS